jgi:glycosyltransferase involved in cell wall biosynthesis
MSPLSICWVTDIPTPYRNHRYERMTEIFPALGLAFEVQFMALSDPLRPWSFASRDLRYPHRVHSGVNLHRIADSFHVNPGLMVRLPFDRRDVLVVGGWSYPTAMVAPFAVPARMLRLLESESNLESGRYNDGLARRLKARVIGRYDGYIGPSPRSRELLAHLCPPAAHRPFLEFPNLIDKGVFGDQVARSREERAAIRSDLGVEDGTALWVCPARLETFKGLDLFIPLLEGVERVLLMVCGDGTLRGPLQAMIDAKRLPVRLAGQQAEAAMVRLYAAADLFVLPSLRDPSPLSPIEACAAQLPLLVSRRIGNFEDVLDDGVNGWGYDADRPDLNRALIERIAATPRDALAAMGRRSRERYDARFDSDACIRRLGEGILGLYERHRLSARDARAAS